MARLWKLFRKVVKGMKQSLFLHADEVFPGSIIINNRAFKMVDTRDESALLAVVCPIQAANSALTGAKSVRLQDCFECLSPTENAA
jgi:hypothetical protein